LWDFLSMEWMPIDSAPKDGTPVLGWSLDFGYRDTVWGSKRPGWGPDWLWEEPMDGYTATWEPTHWMPLPKPPVA
jgi:hypothetical protein